ncbi:MAG: hypothetical protein H0Z29_05370 [Candidatus Marinimicrobia bacterium]|nr:hypothetical protein [Candidatus Neomarinimicrobiota bacterium]
MSENVGSRELWNIPKKSLDDLTPVKLRDLILECFFHAQKETIAFTKQKLGQQPDDESIRSSVYNMVKMMFKRFNEDFDNPTKEGICKVVNEMAKISKAWGTPEHIIEHHKKQILDACKYL